MFVLLFSFVPQDDIISADLTVYENLTYAAQLRLPRDWTRERKHKVVTDTIHLLGLDATRDPGEAVWNAATADAVVRARAQAETIAGASGRSLGPVRYVSVLMRSHDGTHALVSVAVRFGFAD